MNHRFSACCCHVILPRSTHASCANAYVHRHRVQLTGRSPKYLDVSTAALLPEANSREAVRRRSVVSIEYPRFIDTDKPEHAHVRPRQENRRVRVGRKTEEETERRRTGTDLYISGAARTVTTIEGFSGAHEWRMNGTYEIGEMRKGRAQSFSRYLRTFLHA